MNRLRIMPDSVHISNYKEVTRDRYSLRFLHAVAGDEAGGPAELERVAARWAVDVKYVAREVEIFYLERAHRAGVHFGERHAAVGDDRSVESHEA